MEPIQQIRSRTAVLPYTNIDTDQIIPARFLRTTTREGLGRELFADWRLNADGTLNPDFPLNRPEAAGCSVLVADRNFGCGSSREHAPWALEDYGFQAVIAPSFGDIFRSNCARNRLLAATLDSAACAELREELSARPGARVSIAVSEGRLTGPSGRVFEVGVGEFARACLVDGIDEYDLLARRRARIEEVLARREHLLRPTTRVARPEPSGEHG